MSIEKLIAESARVLGDVQSERRPTNEASTDLYNKFFSQWSANSAERPSFCLGSTWCCSTRL